MEVINSLFYWFNKGGLVMYLLLFFSTMSLAIIIERFRYYKEKRVKTTLFTNRLVEDLQELEPKELVESYGKQNNAASIMVVAGAKAILRGKDPESAMEGAAQIEAAGLRRGLSLLGMTVTLAPILGLLGTVIGMIHSFSVFNIEQGAPMAITGGVGEALVATAAGLLTAILALLGHSYYGHRLDGIMTSLEYIAVVFMDNINGELEKG